MTIITKNYEETIDLGEKLGRLLSGGEFILLVGDLGGGKTQLTKGIARGLGIQETIISPTFTIERVYENPRGLVLHHFDFYRLGIMEREIQSEISDLRADDRNIIVVEWGKNIPQALPEEYLEIEIEYENEVKRKIFFRSQGMRYREIIGGLQ